jgi:hypothetical protein
MKPTGLWPEKKCQQTRNEAGNKFANTQAMACKNYLLMNKITGTHSTD